MAGFPGIGHVAVTVSDLDRSRAFYDPLFGSEPVLDEDAGGFYHVVYAVGGGGLFGLQVILAERVTLFNDRGTPP